MSAEQSNLADSTARTTLDSTNDPGAAARNARSHRSTDATRTTGGLRAWPSEGSTEKRDGEGSSKSPPEKTSDAADQDQNRTRRNEERKGEDRREGERESNETGERMRPRHDGYHHHHHHRRGRGGYHGHHYRRHDYRRRESQATEEDGDENDRRETGRGETSGHSHSHRDHRHRDPQTPEEDGDENDRRETGRGETFNRRFSSDYWDGRSPEEVINGFQIGIKKRNRAIEALENENAEQATEIEKLKAQLTLLARAQTERDQLDQLLTERTAELSSAQAFLGKADSISVTEVSKMVELLNAEVLQAAALVADSLSQRKITKDDQPDQAQVNDAMHAVKSFIGPRLQFMLLADIIDPDTKFDPTLSQIILQSGLINACALVIKGWNPPDWESFSNLEKLYSAIRSSEGQTIAGRWRALAHTYIAAQSENDTRAKCTEFLKQILRNLLIAIGWSARGPHVPTPPQYEEKLDNVMKKALEIQKVIGKGITSSDLQTHAIPFEQWFNAEFMKDAYGDGEDGPVLCTIELGLQYEKIVTSGRAGGEQRESGTILKPGVVLVSALEGIRKAASV